MKNKKFKIGIVLETFKVNKFDKQIIEKLSLDKNIDLVAILTNKKFKKKNTTLIKILFFKFIFNLEKFLLQFFFKELKELDKAHPININKFKKVINLKKIEEKNILSNKYDEVSKNNLDLILTLGVDNIFKKKNLKISRLGVFSINYSNFKLDNNTPPGFWETYLNKSETGFVFQLYNNKSNNENILFKGEFATKRFFSLNQYNLLRESGYFLVKTIKKISTNQININNKKFITKSKIYEIPNIITLIKYLFIKITLFLTLFQKRIIFNKRQKWVINYSRGPFDKIDLKKSKIIKNLKDRYFADPFVFSHNNKKYIFVEDFFFKTKKGSISVIEIDDNDKQKIYEKVIDETFHMSFPFVFMYKHNLYMVPETAGANSIRLYKCIKFPNKWKYCYDLISNIRSVDNLIINNGNKYYLLTSTSNYDDFSSKLEIYISNNPISKTWTPHVNNPVYFDLKKGRNGGIIFKNKEIFRACQTYGINTLGDNQYGNKLSINRINSLNQKKFSEETILNIKPNFKKNLLGIHHLNGTDDFTVFDYCYYD